MKSYLEINKALELENPIFIDVRSPSEYNKDCINGAINVPILDDSERVEIGKLYKKEGFNVAKSRGFQLKAEDMSKYFLKVKELSKIYDNVIIYCWRGGHRSGYVYDYLYHSGLKNVHKLIGGYKSYRKHVTKELERMSCKTNFVVLHGRTGVGKTEILTQLEYNGFSTVDLELLASNAGSVFGNVFYPEDQPNQKKFESRLFCSLRNAKNKYVFIESESKRIGRIYIPDCVYDTMKNGEHLLIETSLKVRVEQIKKDYMKSETNISLIIEALEHLRKKVGNEEIDRMKKDLKEGRIDRVIEVLMTRYYDPMYDKSITKYEPYKKIINYNKLDEAVKEIERIVRIKDVS